LVTLTDWLAGKRSRDAFSFIMDKMEEEKKIPGILARTRIMRLAKIFQNICGKK
jgi:hypothetical protein